MKLPSIAPAPALLALVSVLLLSACDGGLFGPDPGNVRFVLSSGSDAALAGVQSTDPQPSVVDDGSSPALSGSHHDDDDDDDHGWDRGPRFQSANVTFSSILARNLDGVLVDVDMDLPATVDVMVMDRGREIELPEGNLPEGTYDQLVVVMTEAEGVLQDGTTITITPPGGGWTAIVPVCPFDVEDGATSVVGLRFAVRRSFFWRDSRVHFQPRFTCETPEPEPESQPEG